MFRVNTKQEKKHPKSLLCFNHEGQTRTQVSDTRQTRQNPKKDTHRNRKEYFIIIYK